MVRSDLDLAGKAVFQQRPDFAKTIGPVGADEVKTNGSEDEEDSGSDEEPAAFVGPHSRGRAGSPITPAIRTCRWRPRGGQSCHTAVLPLRRSRVGSPCVGANSKPERWKQVRGASVAFAARRRLVASPGTGHE